MGGVKFNLAAIFLKKVALVLPKHCFWTDTHALTPVFIKVVADILLEYVF